MNTSKNLLNIVVVISLALCAVMPVRAEGEPPIGLIVPYFEGKGWLTRNVPTVLDLQIWQTLRREPYPNPEKLYFGDGIMKWAEFPLENSSHQAAEKLAKAAGVQMTLWGNAFPYGEGVVVQTYLSIPQYNDGRMKQHEIWTVSITLNGQNHRIEADIPHRYYEFAPIVLRKDVVRKYSSPGALKIYREKEMKTEIGTVGGAFEAKQNEGEKELVEANGAKGWVYLPSLSTQRNEVVDFTGGLIRIYRADWSGAIELMTRVARNKETPTSIKVDAYLFQALAKVKLRTSPDRVLQKAKELSPNSSAVIVYDVMNNLELLGYQIRNSHDGKIYSVSVMNLTKKIKNILNENRYLFSENDLWVRSVDGLIQQILE